MARIAGEIIIRRPEFDRPRRLASATHSRIMDTVGWLAFEPATAGTRMRWSWEVRPHGYLRFLTPAVGALGRRQERSIWAGLKCLLESDIQPRTESRDPAGGSGAEPIAPVARSGVLERATNVETSYIPSVLVTYASAHNATKGVAQRIAVRLGDRGANVEAMRIEDVGTIDRYDTVVLGSAVYNQRWIPSATEFLRRHADTLVTQKLWLFSVGSFGDTHRVIGRLMRKEPRDIETITESVHPLDYRVFAGVIERDQWPLPSRLFFHAFGGRFGDNRDWTGIDAWADEIALTLNTMLSPPRTQARDLRE